MGKKREHPETKRATTRRRGGRTLVARFWATCTNCCVYLVSVLLLCSYDPCKIHAPSRLLLNISWPACGTKAVDSEAHEHMYKLSNSHQAVCGDGKSELRHDVLRKGVPKRRTTDNTVIFQIQIRTRTAKIGRSPRYKSGQKPLRGVNRQILVRTGLSRRKVTPPMSARQPQDAAMV